MIRLEKRVHFIAGLPRSGSTLLAALLRQNPRFHAAMTSPVGALFGAMVSQMGIYSEYSVFFSEEKKQSILESVFAAYYQDQADKEVIFDTNRGWCARLPALKRLFPQSKVICCVRDVAWVMDSFERLNRQNAFDNSRLYSEEEQTTVYSRTESLMGRGRVVGSALAGLKEACYGEHASSMLLVDYDLLTRFPQNALALIYKFIDEEYFEHDYENVEYEASEFDAWLGVKDLHKVKQKVVFKERKTTLPPDLFEQYSSVSFWYNLSGSEANVISVKTDPTENQDRTVGAY